MSHGLSFFNAIFTMAVVAILLVWGVTALTNGDPLWFLSSFNAQAEELIIYWDGNLITLNAQDQGYEAIMRAFAEAIARPAAFEGKVGFSEESINHYKEGFKLLEVQFQQPVQVHTRYPYLRAKTYFVPLDKTHALFRRVFSFPGYMPYTSGPINLNETAFNGLYTAVENVVVRQ